jgi:23S rRNA G2445 N2-methylase RlmL
VHALPILARTLRGIEWIARKEVEARLGVRSVELGHRELRFAVPELTPELLALGTVDDVFLVAGEIDEAGRQRKSLTRIAAAAPCVDLDGLARLLRRRGSRTFDVVGSFLGKRNFSRFELEDAVGHALAAATGWSYLSRAGGGRARGDLSLRVHLAGAVATLAVRIAPAPLHRRAYRVASVPGSLHPPLARAIALLAHPRPGTTLLDPFCGAGTIPIEAALACPGLHAVGFDLDRRALAAAGRNAAAGRVEVAFAHADAGRSPLPNGAVDCIATNPPWGASVVPAGRLQADLGAVARELERVLTPDGRAALLMRGDFPRGNLRVVLATRVRVSGALVELVVLSRRTSAPQPGAE